MGSRAEKIIAEVERRKEEARQAEARAAEEREEAERQRELEKLNKEAHVADQRQLIWKETGVLELLEELSELIPGSSLVFSEDNLTVEFVFHTKSVYVGPGIEWTDYFITVKKRVIPGYLFFKAQTSVLVNDKEVGKVQSLEDLVVEAMANPKVRRDYGGESWPSSALGA